MIPHNLIPAHIAHTPGIAAGGPNAFFAVILNCRLMEKRPRQFWKILVARGFLPTRTKDTRDIKAA
jgi:hypothetical protein